ncbi:MAG TPA: thioredoxin [Gemmatimonadales bacterium]|nr:thioredoxin [Gemmatimonadales bacterium]
MSTTTEMMHVTDATFAAEVEGVEGQVLVDFWAEWCGPCHMVAPVLAQLAAERTGTLKVVKVNADENQRTAARFGIRGLPTMLLFKGGKPVAQIVGAVPKGKIEAVLDQHA